MNDKKNLKTIVLVIVAALLVLSLYLIFDQNRTSPVNQNLPTETEQINLIEEDVLALLRNELLGGGCYAEGVTYEYSSCSVDIVKNNGIWEVMITHDGLFDDSVRASRIQTQVINQDGEWINSEIIRTYQCQEGRGQQEFSADLCL